MSGVKITLVWKYCKCCISRIYSLFKYYRKWINWLQVTWILLDCINFIVLWSNEWDIFFFTLWKIKYLVNKFHNSESRNVSVMTQHILFNVYICVPRVLVQWLSVGIDLIREPVLLAVAHAIHHSMTVASVYLGYPVHSISFNKPYTITFLTFKNKADIWHFWLFLTFLKTFN